MKCLQCSIETTNPKFCSRSCAATYNNVHTPKRSRELIECAACSQLVKGPRRKYCSDECNPNRRDWSKISIRDIQSRYPYQVSTRIRSLARAIYHKSDKPQLCIKCGYDKHFEVCHVKGISNFHLDVSVAEVNSLKNLQAVCRNCHWELDHL